MILYAFFAIAIICILSALGMILSRNPIHSIISLILCFFSISGLYTLLNAQFLAVVNVIVYAGAIMVLFLFVVMMMNLNEENEPKVKMGYYILPALASGILGLVLIAAVKKAALIPVGIPNDQAGMIENLGKVLLQEYLLPFEMTSVLFLSAMVGVVLLAKRDKSVEEKI